MLLLAGLASLTGCGTCDARASSSGDPLQDAIDAASEGGTLVVCAGTYRGTFTIDKQLSLVSQEDTTGVWLDGDGDGPILTITDAAVVLENIGFQHAGTGSDGRGGGVWIEQENSLDLPYVTMDGVRVQEGDDSGVVITGGTLVGLELALDDNSAEVGGGLRVLAGAVSLEDPTFAGNDADLGGGIYVDDGGDVTISGGEVCENRATNGGGAWLVAGTDDEEPGELTAISSDWCEGARDNSPDDVATVDQSYTFGDNVDFSLQGPVED